MAFEVYKGRRRQAATPTATITPAGCIYFNTHACQQVVRGARRVVLYFDLDHNCVGLRFLADGKEEDTRAYRVTHYTRQGGGSAAVSCRRFFRDYGIPFRQLQRELVFNRESELFTFGVPTQ